jgi:AhpD family alkylhydroperoxidase
MEARIKNLQTILNDAWGPMVALGKSLATSPIPEKTRELVHIRTAQVNGCAVCLDGHVAIWDEAKRHYDEAALAWLVFEVAVANLYNRPNVATRQVAGTQRW